MLTRDTTDKFRRQIANLQPGDTVRVSFSDGVVAVGTLHGASRIFASHDLTLTLVLPNGDMSRGVRIWDGQPAPGVRQVEPWDEESWRGYLRTSLDNIDSYEDDLARADASERGGLEKCLAEERENLRTLVEVAAPLVGKWRMEAGA
jgi:hypothetical protein